MLVADMARGRRPGAKGMLVPELSWSKRLVRADGGNELDPATGTVAV